MEPGIAETLRKALQDAAQKQKRAGQSVVLPAPDALRSHAGALRPARDTHLHVLAFGEISDARQIKGIATIGR